jgi:hypothetical protein
VVVLALNAPLSAATPKSLFHSPLSSGPLTRLAIQAGLIPQPGAPASTKGVAAPGVTVLPNVVASEGTGSQNETPIAADPNNPSHLLTGANDSLCSSSLQGFYSSDDGGATWPHKVCLGTLPGQSGDGDPVVGYDLSGNAYIGGIDTNASFVGSIVFSKSSNNGVSWSAPAVAVHATFSNGLTDKEWMEIDHSTTSPHPGAIYISVTQFGVSNQSQISVSHSYDGGATWATSFPGSVQNFPAVDQFSDLAVGRDGTVYASWLHCVANGPSGDCANTTATMMFSKSTDGGLTWSIPVAIHSVKLTPDPTFCCFYGALPVTTGIRVSNIPVIDVDRSSGPLAGHLYVADYNWTGTQMRVQVATSTDGGTTWGAPVFVGDAGATKDMFFPWLSVNNTGKIGVTWYDRRADAANRNYQEFMTGSTNGGVSFKPNKLIATAASDPTKNGWPFFPLIGDYSGNIWAGNTLHASWNDTRTNTDQDETGGISFP